MTDQTPVEKTLLQPASTWLERAVGLVAMAVALLLALATYALGRALLERPITSIGVVILFGVLVVLTVLFVLAGHRLVFGQPNRHGSLFAPWVWFAISATLLITTLFVGVVALKQPSVESAQGVLSSLLLALLSYGAGSHFRRKARDRAGAA
jgi:hypothetical protein